MISPNQKLSNLKAKVTMLFVVISGSLLILSGCNNAVDSTVTSTGTGTGTGSDDNISLSVQSQDNITDNATIEITEAKGLLTEIEVETSGTSKRVKAGPLVVQLNVAGINQVMTSGIIPTGTYSKVKFQLHKPEDSEVIPDPEFREGSSGNQRYSFIIKGKYNGAPFVYKTRKTINIVMDLNSPLNLTTKSNLTILFDKMKWFSNGSTMIDPTSGSNDDLIDDNIKNSFRRAFKDDDKNGVPDDH